MATLLRFKDEEAGCFASIRLESGEPVFVSVAQSGVRVKKSKTGLFGEVLFASSSAEHAVQTAATLMSSYPDLLAPDGMRNPALRAYSNAVLHCRSAEDVVRALGQPKEVVGHISISPSTDDKHSQLMGLAMRRAVMWGVVAQVLWFAAYLGSTLLEGQWADAGYNGYLVFPIVAVGYFLWKRADIRRKHPKSKG